MSKSKGIVVGLAVASIVTLAAGNARAAGEIMQPGKWQITATTEMEGMPAAAGGHPMSFEQCVKPEDVKDPKTIAERQSRGNKNCTVSEPKIENHTMSFDFTCKNGSTGHTEFKFAGATYTGTTTIDMKGGPNGAMKMVQHVEAKRTGDC